MENLNINIRNYLDFCQNQKRLDNKTLKAYQIDLRQFSDYIPESDVASISSNILEPYISQLHQKYQPKTVKRKIASVKAFFHYLEYKEIIAFNPFNKMQIHFREPVVLPKVIPLNTLELFLSSIYRQKRNAKTNYQKQNALRDAAVIELLFATGMRISEVCSLKKCDINLYDGVILIHGKGKKERRLQICNEGVINILREYQGIYYSENADNFFINQNGTPLSDQSVRRIIKKYSGLAAIELHITPHMFRHTFATSLLENDVDIRYIQEMLGHSSINITEIYTHVAISKQKDILSSKHPRNNFKL